ncbi:hypothetical protein ACWEQ7_23405 [Streptomyces sp. NPDC004069]
MHVSITVRVAPGATPQAYYFCPYAVQDLGITVARVHFTVGPAPDTGTRTDTNASLAAAGMERTTA